MNVLFFMSHPGHVRNFESTLRELAERGHGIHVAFDRESEPAADRRSAIDVLARDHERIGFGPAASPERTEQWTLIAWQLRAMLDYLRYLEPPYAHAPRLRERAARAATRPVAKSLALSRTRPWLKSSLSALERSVPPRRSVLRFLAEREPDLVLVTPLLDLGSPQLDYVRAAKSLGIPSAFCVASWDNLTNKGLLHELPTLVTVWNEAQRREAVELHGVPEPRVAVTGAQSYDRADFLQAVGLPFDRPFLLYAASSPFLAPREGDSVARWVRALRGSQELSARRVSILIRPHPLNPFPQQEVDQLGALEGVRVWPPRGEDPTDEPSRTDYFDSMHHAAAVIGLNTSVMIEAAIVGRPVFTIILPEFSEGQLGTLHFRYLLAENGGPAASATSLEKHVSQLAATLRGETASSETTAFLRSFIRPNGLNQPATPRLVEALEEAARRPSEPPTAPPRAAVAARPLLVAGGSIALPVHRLARRRVASPKA